MTTSGDLWVIVSLAKGELEGVEWFHPRTIRNWFKCGKLDQAKKVLSISYFLD